MIIHEQTKAYEWDAIEFSHQPKSTDWYWALGIAVIAGCVLSIIGGNVLLAVLLFIGGVLIGFSAGQAHPGVHIVLSERGIGMNKQLYPYESIKSFWIYRDHRGADRIILTTERAVMPLRSVTLPKDIKATEIREYLLNFIPEKQTKPSSMDLLAESLGL
jgi:hypothetical protein